MGRSILIVDDNVDIAETTAVLLGMYGHATFTASDAESAMASARSHVPDIILLDIGLPDTDGYALATMLRNESTLANTTLIAMTGYGSEDDREKALSAGFDHHLVKPTDMEQLLSLLK